MSRAGRDYLQTGFYTEVFFRQHHVHFVAIANSVDSDDQNSNEFAPFLNIMNEWYLRDLSRKQKTSDPCERRIRQAYHQLCHLWLQENAG